jgi:hypothetical protein
VFRHCMATLMLEIRPRHPLHPAYARLLGFKTTQIYTQVSIRQLKPIHAATHPHDWRIRRKEMRWAPTKLHGPIFLLGTGALYFPRSIDLPAPLLTDPKPGTATPTSETDPVNQDS